MLRPPSVSSASRHIGSQSSSLSSDCCLPENASESALPTQPAQLTVQQQAAGVKTCYGIVGDTMNRIAHAIDRSKIDWVHMRHEEAGAFAAAAKRRSASVSQPAQEAAAPAVSTSSMASTKPIAIARR